MFQFGSLQGTNRILSSGPFSSLIRNSAIGLALITQPGNVGSDTQTMASRGSSSSAQVSGMKP